MTSQVQIKVHPNPTIEMNRKFLFVVSVRPVEAIEDRHEDRATYSQNLHSTKSIHFSPICQCTHIAGLNKTFLRILLVIKTSHGLLRIRPGFVEGRHDCKMKWRFIENSKAIFSTRWRRFREKEQRLYFQKSRARKDLVCEVSKRPVIRVPPEGQQNWL